MKVSPHEAPHVTCSCWPGHQPVPGTEKQLTGNFQSCILLCTSPGQKQRQEHVPPGTPYTCIFMEGSLWTAHHPDLHTWQHKVVTSWYTLKEVIYNGWYKPIAIKGLISPSSPATVQKRLGNTLWNIFLNKIMFSHQQMNFIDIFWIHRPWQILYWAAETQAGLFKGWSLHTNPVPTEMTETLIQLVYSRSSLWTNILVCWDQQAGMRTDPGKKD